MSRSPITHLRHAGFVVPDFEASTAFYEGPWGLTRVADDDGIAFFGAEGSPEQYILRVRKGEAPSLELVALGVDDAATVDRLAEEVAGDGLQLVTEPAKLDTPGGGYGFRFFDPDGRLTEISSDVAERPHRELAVGESTPVRLSHVVLNTTDSARLCSFYEQRLGFRLSDKLGDFMFFMRCQTDHHTVAVTQWPAASMNHLSFEIRDVDEFMRGTGRNVRAGAKLLWGPGRHTAGDNTFSYFEDPSGHVVEYSTALEQIVDEDSWEVHTYTLQPEHADQWGTAGPPTPEIMSKGRDNDPGLWAAAPV